MKRLLDTNRMFVIFLIFIAALMIRVYQVDEPPLNFHATRQYRSLTIARGYYYAGLADVPEWKRQVASLNFERQGILEPPVMELLTAAGYYLLGGERYWIPKFLSIMFWLTGAIFLYRIADSISGRTAALFSVAYFLFVPFAIVASRSFQPDPLMVMLLLASIHAMLQSYDRSSTTLSVQVVALSALTIFIKPVSLFLIYTVFTILTIEHQGIKKGVTSRRFFLFFLLTFLPALVFYLLYGLFLSGDLQLQAQASFIPQILFDSFFWKGWIYNTGQVVPLPILTFTLLVALTFSKGLARSLLFGLWIGYVFFCLVFSYHIASHDYYHLQLIPIVALSLGTVLALAREHLNPLKGEWIAHLVTLIILTAGIALGIFSVRGRLADPSSGEKIRQAEAVGDLVDHSTNTVYLASDYGLSLQYHGELSGQPWPLVSDLEWEQLSGIPVLNAEARFQHWFANAAPDYFIVMDLWEYEQQKDLEAFLTHTFPIVARSDQYLIFDLRSR